MPRAKVQESHRQRAIQACAPCKASKRRCDCQQPCSNCVKRRDVASCVFKAHLPRIPGQPKLKTTPRRSNAASDAEHDGVATQIRSQEAQAKQEPWSRASRSSTDGPNTSPNMLWTSRGAQVYVGSSASLSFLILLRDTLTRYTGASTFTDASQSSIMLENRAAGTTDDSASSCGHSLDEHISLIDVYHAATSGVLDVLPSEDDVFSHLQSLETFQSPASSQSAVIHAALAIGAQCRSEGPQDQQCERFHIATARQAAFEALRDDQLDVNLVRVYIIMAYYMFGACRRNTAFMYIGIAARASDALGLHLQRDYTMIWQSVRILDLLVAAILGRSPSTTASETSSVLRPGSGNASHRELCLNASFDVWTTIDQIVNDFYRRNHSDTATARAFLNKLSRWSAELSPMVKTSPPGLTGIQQQEHVIGNIHVACAYYYAVVIATRKFLITSLHSSLTASIQPLSRQSNGYKQVDKSETEPLAQACVESALLLLQTCQEAHGAGMLLDNMCLLKAWMFAAGMIVGFAFFVAPDTYIGLEAALIGACDVLHHLSILSPQAKQYHDIIQALHKAATEHHQRQALSNIDSQAPLVSKIFSFGDPSTDLDACGSTSDQTLLSSSLATEDVSQLSFTPNIFTTDSLDSVAAQFWDELLLEREQFSL